jgi:hypothetical protein
MLPFLKIAFVKHNGPESQEEQLDGLKHAQSGRWIKSVSTD